jgi:hypothetical protein
MNINTPTPNSAYPDNAPIHRPVYQAPSLRYHPYRRHTPPLRATLKVSLILKKKSSPALHTLQISPYPVIPTQYTVQVCLYHSS